LIGASCLAQSIQIQNRAISDGEAPEVQLYIECTNATAALGSKLVIIARIKNSTTNTIAIPMALDPIYDFNLEIIDNFGVRHSPMIKEPIRMVGGNHLMQIKPLGSFETAICIHKLNPSLRPGAYRFSATHSLFTRSNKDNKFVQGKALISSLVDIKIAQD
jgi:hypothetical protein